MNTINKLWAKVPTKVKYYLVSSSQTFAAGFIAFLLVDIHRLTVDDIYSGAVVGLILAAIRAGVKAVLEMTLSLLKK
jgi:hypothetical protein